MIRAKSLFCWILRSLPTVLAERVEDVWFLQFIGEILDGMTAGDDGSWFHACMECQSFLAIEKKSINFERCILTRLRIYEKQLRKNNTYRGGSDAFAGNFFCTDLRGNRGCWYRTADGDKVMGEKTAVRTREVKNICINDKKYDSLIWKNYQVKKGIKFL